MIFQYSKKLKQELIKNFKKEHGVDISEETANEYLNSFGDLFEVLTKNDKKIEIK